MIDIRELRIGNLLIQGGVIGIETDLIDGDNGVYLGMGGFYTTESIEPIPITSELLIKLGFENINGVFVIGNYEVYPDNSKGYWFFDLDTAEVNVNLGMLKYIHQLQNLYFAITDQELTKEYI